MKKYNVTVNGTKYEITLEAVDTADMPAATAPAAPKAAEPAPAPAAPAAKAATAGGKSIPCPMPGTILNVNVTVGSAVKKGDVLMILEAMKMENEIVSPVDGTVIEIGVTKGSAVESGTVLCVIA